MSSSPRWVCPTVRRPLDATVPLPGSKSLTNRALILAALAEEPSTIVGALHSRDTDLMIAALRALGTEIVETTSGTLSVTPRPLHGGSVYCGLAGTIMRFVPPVAALATGEVCFDGDEEARSRPLSTMIAALRSLGGRITGTHLPFTVHGAGTVGGGELTIDASSSSQFVSGLLLAAARFTEGIRLTHSGAQLPSQPHIQMTLSMLRDAGVSVAEPSSNTWVVHPSPICGRGWRIEPDLSNAGAFLAAAAVAGGTVRIPDWPIHTTQAGDAMRRILEQMGCRCIIHRRDDSTELAVTGDGYRSLRGLNINMSDIGELTPTVAALAAVAQSPTTLSGIAHLRGHETNRLHALATEINRLGGRCTETDDGLVITPQPLHSGVWHTYRDHRMAMAGAIVGLAVPGVTIEDIATTTKTLPGFPSLWATMLGGDGNNRG